MRRRIFPLLATAYLLAIYGVPCAAVAALSGMPGPLCFRAATAPLLWVVSLVMVAGLLSRPHQRAIMPGTFPRSLSNPTYFHRRLYGVCWTALYYCTPAYHVCLSLRPLKALAFRLFGYRGALDFTVYPDTWIRDLPLLDLGSGAYVSNRATLGTNIVLANGRILVDRIVVGPRALVGHLTMLAPGVEIEEAAEIAVGCAIGVRVRVGPRAHIGGLCRVENGARIGAGANVGNCSFVASRSSVRAGQRVPPASVLRLADGRPAALRAVHEE